MRVFKNMWFEKFAVKEGILDRVLCDIADRVLRGDIDADLGGSVFKQRIARQGGGKSGGYRSILLFKMNHAIFFVYGYAKSDKSGLTRAELLGFRKLAKQMFSLPPLELDGLLERGALKEVYCHGKGPHLQK